MSIGLSHQPVSLRTSEQPSANSANKEKDLVGSKLCLKDILYHPNEALEISASVQDLPSIEIEDKNREVDDLSHFLDELDQISEVIGCESRDLEQYTCHAINARDQIDALKEENHPTDTLRKDIKSNLIHSALSLLLKKAPRFSQDKNGSIHLDTTSYQWTPSYYKILSGLPHLRPFIDHADILDPFAGPGMLMNSIVATGEPQYVVYGDISYNGGNSLSGNEYDYDPHRNRKYLDLFFSGLPKFYRPELTKRVTGFVTLDARTLPFKNDTFDWIITDPPYGINLADGGLEFLISVQEEMRRVSKNGLILLAPVSWIPKIRDNGLTVYPLTGELSNGLSRLPTCFFVVEK